MLAPYPDFEAVRASVEALGPVETFGQSVEGRPLLALDLGGEGPVAVVTAGLHGIEHIGVQVALEVARRGPIDGVHLYVLPVLNPDGFARTHAEGGMGPVRRFRKNANGVDLNRNFPIPGGVSPSRLPFAAASDPDSATYRGPHACSEPESAAVTAWMNDHRPILSVNCHSFMGSLIPARVWTPGAWLTYSRLCRVFRRAQPRIGYLRLSTPLFDVFTGELEDWQHHSLGCWSICVESFTLLESVAQHRRAPSGFWRFNPRDPASVAARDATAVRALLAEAPTLERPGLFGRTLEG
jgi:hypothetical protein